MIRQYSLRLIRQQTPIQINALIKVFLICYSSYYLHPSPDSSLTEWFLHADWHGRVGRRSHAGLVLGRHAELVGGVSLERPHSIVGQCDSLLNVRSRPLVGSLQTILHDVVRDLRSTVVLWRTPREGYTGVCDC